MSVFSKESHAEKHLKESNNEFAKTVYTEEVLSGINPNKAYEHALHEIIEDNKEKAPKR